MLHFVIGVIAYLIALHMTHTHLKMINNVQTVFYGDFYYLTSYAYVVIDDQPMQQMVPMDPIIYPAYDNYPVYVTPHVNQTNNSLHLFGQMM